MKEIYRKIIPSVCVAVFILFWISLFILAMLPNRWEKLLGAHAPFLKATFGVRWRLFTPPQMYNTRLYLVLTDRSTRRTDTVEVLENLSLQKQRAAPFNQKENIIAHLVNNSSKGLLNTTWKDKKLPAETDTGATMAAHITRAVEDASHNKNYQAYLATLKKNCKLVLKEKNIETAGKNVQIIITVKMSRPFKEMNNNKFFQKEILVFETPYMPFDQ